MLVHPETPRSSPSTSNLSIVSGEIAADVALNCTARWSTPISEMAGVKMPVSTFPLQAAVTELVRPYLNPVIVSGTLHVYVNQIDRGNWSSAPRTPAWAVEDKLLYYGG
jgi:glycine/D-amino acid oxidase-like deaminating enzyme